MADIAYVLKGYPRLSEIFIASEIARVEQAGVSLRLVVLKQPDEHVRHGVVQRISAQPQYLPPMSSLSRTTLVRWLRENLPAYAPALWRVARAHPASFTRACGLALAQAVRARQPRRLVRKLYVKELLQAAGVADQLLDDDGIRHIHAHFAHGATTVAWLAAEMLGLPFSFTGHAKDIYAESLNPAGLLRRKLSEASFAITCTEVNRAHLLELAPGARVHRIYHGLNDDVTRLLRQPEAATAEHSTAETFRVLGVGRLVAKKGFDLLVEAVARLVDKGIDIKLVLIGQEGDASAALRSRVAALGLGARVEFTGPLLQDALLEQYRAADVFALPCRLLDDGDRDGIPNVMVEAMAVGVPVVTTPVSGIPELVRDGENGLLVDPEDPDALAAALLRVRDDAALARRITTQARSDVRENFDGDHLARQLVALFTVGEPRAS